MKIKNTCLFIFALTFAFLSSFSCWASAPKSNSSNSGFYRLSLGAFEVTVLSDGTIDLPMSKLLVGVNPSEYQKAIAKNFISDPIETSDNAFLVNTGKKLVLIDTGAGKLFGPTLGKILVNLKAAGYTPDQVDAVLITHMHPDHIGGLLADDKIAFPNATVYADKADADYWLSAENLSKAPEANKGFFQGAQNSLNPYIQAGKTKWFSTETEIIPGIKSQASHGHTPGHTTYVIESEGKKLLLYGDLVHVAAVQFEKPSVTIQFDTDPKMAEANRKAAFASAAKEGYLIGAPHLPFPGVGHIRADKKAFVFVPANYTR